MRLEGGSRWHFHMVQRVRRWTQVRRIKARTEVVQSIRIKHRTLIAPPHREVIIDEMRTRQASPALSETSKPAPMMMYQSDAHASHMMRPCDVVAAASAQSECDQSMLSNPTSPASPSDMSRLAPPSESPRCISRPATLLDVDLQCPISRSVIRQGDALCQLPCRHVLLEHATPQLLSSACPRCPICFSCV